MTMPGAEVHINVQSQEEIHVIDFFPILPQPIPTMAYAQTQLNEAKAEPNYMSNHREITIIIPNPNYNSEIQVTLLPSQDGNRQSL
jgi:hypothetical protein